MGRLIESDKEATMPKQPRIESIARGVLIHESRVLMCQNLKHGYFYLPGGHIEFGERARDALTREMIEETGLSCTVGPLLVSSEHYFDDSKRTHHEINLVFHMEQLGDQPSPPEIVESIEDDIGFAWIDLAQVLEADISPPEMKAWLMSGGAVDNEQGHWISGFGEGG